MLIRSLAQFNCQILVRRQSNLLDWRLSARQVLSNCVRHLFLCALKLFVRHAIEEAQISSADTQEYVRGTFQELRPVSEKFCDRLKDRDEFARNNSEKLTAHCFFWP